MTPFDSTITIRLPAELAEIASKIGRALDNDSGGADSFSLSEDELTISTTTPCTSLFKEQAEYMLANPEMLYQLCLQDYSQRWSDLVVPTLEECQLFCSSVIVPPEELLV